MAEVAAASGGQRLRGSAGVVALVAAAAFLPFARGVVSGHCFYFRDLARQFFPWRRFSVEGLLSGEFRYWNPYVHEGEPLLLLPLFYPLDMLQALVPDEKGFSLLLALHVPLAALALLALARGVGLGRTAAAGGALVYALGGFTLSCLNLYVLLQAVAWAPLVVLTLIRAAEGPQRRVVPAALVLGVALSTLGVEIVVQAVVAGILLAGSSKRLACLARLGLSLALGLGLAAPALLLSRDLVAGSARGHGFPTDAVLAFSVHPVTFLQVLVAGLYGETSTITTRFWGANFTTGFPYIMSLYLGAGALVLAALGASFGRTYRWRLLLLALVGAGVCLGPWAKLDLLVNAVPPLRALRFPVKAFFTVQLAMSLLTALGLDALARSTSARPWRWFAPMGIGLGGLLALAPLLPHLAPQVTRRCVEWFFPPGQADRADAARAVLADAAVGGLVALAAGVLASLVLARRIAPQRAALGAALLVAADVLRAGAGLNPMVSSSFYRLSPEMSAAAVAIRTGGGRLFTCEPEFSLSFQRAGGSLRGAHDLWAVATYMETLTPFHNMRVRVSTALSRDVTMLVPVERVFPKLEEVACASVPAIQDRLRAAGVSHLLSLGPLETPGLRLLAVASPARIAPLSLHVYALDAALPLRALAKRVKPAAGAAEAEVMARESGFQAGGGVAVEGAATELRAVGGSVTPLLESPDRLEFQVEAEAATMLIVRDAYAPGWSAEVNGVPAPILRADGRHRAVPVPSGNSIVTMSYRPPSLGRGLGIAALSALAAAVLRRSTAAAPLSG